MADPRLFLSNMRYAKSALEAAANIIQQDPERAENQELSAICISIGEKARVLSNMLGEEEKLIIEKYS